MKKKSFVKFLVVSFPIGLMLLGAGSLFLYEQRRVDKHAEHPMSQPVTEKGMIIHYKKLKEFMSPRGYEGEAEKRRLIRTTAFIDGSLAPMNTGMTVQSEKVLTTGGRIWKSYKMEYAGKGKEGGRKYVVNYRTAPNHEIAAVLTFAEGLPRVRLSAPVEILFTPEGAGVGFNEVVSEAYLRGQGQSLCYDGIDWEYLRVKLVEELAAISLPE